MQLCIFGDSITWGLADTVNGGWVPPLRRHFEKIYREHYVYNLGIEGDTTTLLLKRFKVEAIARAPTAILFAIGINDSIEVAKISLDTFSKNLETLLVQSRETCATPPKVAFLGLTRVDEAGLKINQWELEVLENAIIARYDAALQAFCQKHQLPYLSLANTLSAEDLDDGLHPNAQGHEKLYKAILPFVEKFLF